MSEGKHWYFEDGTPCFELPNKSKPGQMRGVTKADARKLHLFPSVNTVASDVLAKSDLNNSAKRKLTEWCFTYHPEPGEHPKDYHKRADTGAFAEWRAKRDLGTEIHKALEQHFQGQAFGPSLAVYVEAVDKWVAENGVTFLAHELRLVNKPYGYAGTTDGRIRLNEKAPVGFSGKSGILDFKSTGTTAGKPVAQYPDYAMQISAYAAAYNPAVMSDIGVNVFISTTEPGRVEAVWYDAERLAQEWEVFQAALKIWRHRNGYDPRRKE